MTEFDRLSGDIEYIGVEFVEQDCTPSQIGEFSIQLYATDVSISNTKQYFESLGADRSRTSIHNWIQKVDLQPAGDGVPN